MATPVIMPALGMAQDTGRIVRWLKEEGESVRAGEPIMEIETDKVTVEIEAPASGILARIQAPAGSEVPVGEVVAWIAAPGEAILGEGGTQPEAAPTAPSRPAPASPEAPRPTPVAARLAAQHKVPLEAVPASGRWIRKEDVLAYLSRQQTAAKPREARPPRVPASPKARRLAAEYRVDLAQVPGSGPEGAVLAADVLAYVAARQTGPAFWTTSVWRTMARHTQQSWQEVPHFYLHREVSAQRLMVWRERVQQRVDIKITYTDLLVKLVAAALREHPHMHAIWTQDGPRLVDGVHIGLAVATESGLVVPVIHDVDRLTVIDVAQRRMDLVQRAQENRLRLEDVQGGGFTISNLGMYGVDTFHPIVNAPQVALLAVGRILQRPVATRGQVVVEPTLHLVLACDHRAVDGARGARFLDTLASYIEEPLTLLV